MNILIMSKIFAKSGVGSHIMDLSETLKKRGNFVAIMSGTNDHPDFLKEKGIIFLQMPFSMEPVQFGKNIVVIVRFLKEHKIDIVHCHHRICAFYMRLISKITGIPFVWTNHLDNIPSDFIHRNTTFYGKQAICVSTDLKNFCMKKLRIPENKISVIYNGIRPEEYTYDKEYVKSFRAKYSLEKKKVIGLFARMAPIKGHLHLINAIEMIPRWKMNDYVVVFFGGGGR